MKFKQKLLLVIGIVLFSICTIDVEAAESKDYEGSTAKLNYVPFDYNIAIPVIGLENPLGPNNSNISRDFNYFTLTTTSGEKLRALCMDAMYGATAGGTYKITSTVSKSISIPYYIYEYANTHNTSNNDKALSQIASWVFYYNPKNVKWGDKEKFVTAFVQYKYSLLLQKIFKNPDLYINLKNADDETPASTDSDDKVLKTWKHYAEELIENPDSIESIAFKNYLYNKILESSTYSIKTRVEYDTVSDFFSRSLLKMGVSYSILTAVSKNAILASEKYYDTIHQGLVNKYADDLCIYESTSGKSLMQRFLAPCTIGEVTIDPTPTPTPDPTVLYGEVETIEVYKTCTESSDDAIQGYTYEYYNPTKVVTEKTDLASGEFVKNIGSYCAVYCLEDTAEVFPGNVNTPVGVGSYLIWPTSAATANSIYSNDYSLELKGTKSCHIELAYGGTEYDKYINTTSDPVADVTTLYNTAKASAYKLYAGKYYETYRMDTDDGKDCDSGVFAGTCASDKAELDAALASYGLNTDSYNNINNLYNTMKSVPSASAYYSGADGVTAAQGAAAAAAALEAKGQTPSPSSAQWTQEAANRTAVYNSMVTAESNATNAFNSAAGGNAGSWTSIVSRVSGLQTTYNNCISALNACNTYAGQVQQAINIANEIVNCANYDFTGTEKEIYDWQTYLNVSWADKEYGTTLVDGDLEKTTTVTCTNCTGLGIQKLYSGTRIENIVASATNKIKEVASALPNRQIDVHYDTVYSLPTTGKLLYNYVNKKTLKAVTDISSAGDNYITIGYSNMPISYEADVGVKQPLSITSISFGSEGKYKGIDYVCNYEVSEVTSSCICPEGTLHEGENLVCMLSDNDMSCADAQAAFCDSTSIVDFDTTCDKFCPNDASIDLTACMSAGMSYDDCAATLCDDTYRCKNSNNVGGYMDITACVQTKVAQGSTITEAVNICDATVCPLSGIKIIYRTISLANPFPGKDVSGIVSGFNTTIKGRYPGVNWNSKTLVNNLILDNRGVSDNSLYDVEPLYTFVLTPEVIKEIREYNDSNESSGGYADYTLDCKNNNSTACVSDFVHNTIYGLTGGTCSDATGKNTFYQCTN